MITPLQIYFALALALLSSFFAIKLGVSLYE